MIKVDETVQFLQRVPLFASLNKRQLERLAKRFVEREYAENKEIVTQGRGGEGFFIVVDGKAEAVRLRADGTQVVVNHFGPTDYFGEMALLDDGMRTASVVTRTACQCLVLTRWDFLSELEQDAELAIKILQELARRFRQALEAL